MEQLRYASRHTLDEDGFKNFVAMDWRSICLAKDGELDSINQLSQALVTQMSAKSTCIHSVMTNLIAPFFLGSAENSPPNLTATEKFMFEKLHAVIRDVCQLCPRSSETVCRSLCAAFPFYGTSSPHSFVCYVFNMLSVSSFLRLGEQRDAILFVLDRIYLLDVNTNLCDPDEGLHHIKLEHAVEAVISFMKSSIVVAQGVDENKALQLYDIVFPAFMRTICPSSKTLQSMFWMFYLASMSEKVTQKFCNDMWQVFESQSVDGVRVLGLLTSFYTRSVSVVSDQVIQFLTKLANTCHEHLETVSVSDENILIEKHSRFYAAFQSLMYLIVMRSSDFPDPKILQILQIPKLVNSRLLPLTVCPETIADAFTRTTSQLHITLCIPASDQSKSVLKTDSDTTQDLWIVLHYHSEPLNMIKRRMAHLLRPITDPDVCLVDNTVRSLSFEKHWEEAGALDFDF